MIDFETLPINTVFYHVRKKCNAFNTNKKHTFVDEEGNTWHRYDKPVFEYVVLEYKLIGRLKKVLEGQWNAQYELDTEYLIDMQSSGVEDFFPDEKEFYTLDRSEAEAMAEQKNKELNGEETT
jgi:hypothetical protein